MKSRPLLGKTLPISILAVFSAARANIAQTGSCEDLLGPVWSYTAPEGTDAFFEGTTDPDGNLYWLEFQPGSETQQLVSASRDGSIRYRTDFERPHEEHLISRNVVWAAGFAVIATPDDHVRAFDAKTGALVWDTALSLGYNYHVQLADTDTGVIVVNFGRGLIGIDLASGEELWSHAGETSVSTAGGDIFLGERDESRQVFLTKIDSSGRDIWSELAGGSPVAVLAGETPLIVTGRSEIVVGKEWWELPYPENSNIIAGNDFGFLITLSTQQSHLESFSASDGRILGDQTVSDPYPLGFNGTSLLTQDHLLLVGQDTEPCPCLCHPHNFEQAKVSGWSKTARQLFSCELSDLGEGRIEGTSLYQGSLVVARRHYFTRACTSQIQPLIIEAYDLPGEELADQGWVVPAGNPAQSRRPLQ